MAAWTLLAVSLLVAGHAVAQTQPPVQTIELNIAEAPSGLTIGDPLAVFAFVLRNVPARAQIYPTENYYYFRFAHKGAPYVGNIRLAAADRDKGRVHFAYGVAPTDRRPEPRVRHVVLDAARGVSVEKRSSAEYRVSYSGKTVTFLLNDLSAVKPPDGLLRSDETFLGAIFDESAILFFSGVQSAAEDFPLSVR